MTTWNVALPIAGSLTMQVEADSEEEAIKKAMGTTYDPELHEVTWDVHEHLTTGNVLHADLSDAYAEEEPGE